MDLIEHFRRFDKLKRKITNSWVHDVPEGSMACIALENRIFEKEDPNPSQNGSGQYRLDVDNLDSSEMLRILSRVNMVIQKVADIFETNVRANIITSNIDGQHYLLTYFDDLPLAVFGGFAKLSPSCVQNPPPLQIFQSWRLQFLRSLRRVIPPPLYQKMLRNVDGTDDLDWSIRLVSGHDFVEMVDRVLELENKHNLGYIYSLDKKDFNGRNAELIKEKNRMLKLIEKESRTFWTFERIGRYLRM